MQHFADVAVLAVAHGLLFRRAPAHFGLPWQLLLAEDRIVEFAPPSARAGDHLIELCVAVLLLDVGLPPSECRH